LNEKIPLKITASSGLSPQTIISNLKLSIFRANYINRDGVYSQPTGILNLPINVGVTSGGGSPTLTIAPQDIKLTSDGYILVKAYYDPDGPGTLSPIDVTGATTWNASPSGIVTWSYFLSDEWFSAAGPGTATISATYKGLTANTNITVSDTSGSSGRIVMSLSANGVGTYNTTSVGSNVTYRWTIQGLEEFSPAPTVKSYYTSDRPDNCPGGITVLGETKPWIVSNANPTGEVTATIEECQRGRLYTIFLEVLDQNNILIKRKSLSVQVAP